ncbi:endolytic transglycosylase MltG [Devosia rhodophyticola]|uniref:Endolytic murein transglycosylase n=1 Tax=Devosia rhodophyticola TaxID=3026423 RepID=A0ABY7YWI1_9HYPH|nr:endolytic transglycosylase MltG [Devosia rhodophyticola]WDR05596.1 endolytic transglycosylase MltG [Devosia rhodophyticola]
MNDRKSRRAKPRRRNGFIDILNGILTLFVLGMLVVCGIVLYGASQFYGDGPISKETVFRVESGNGLGLTGQRLEAEGLISNGMIFQIGGRVLDIKKPIKKGDFKIPAGASMADILRELTEGDPIRYAVTIPEGWTSWEVVQRLNADANLKGEISTLPAEGSVLPGSYDYVPGDDRKDVLGVMQKAMTDAVAEVWASRAPDLPIDTPEEMVVLASIVEKETGISTERPEVAAVFVNRLKQSMRLQSDPTIIYGITKGESKLGRGLKRSEIEQQTPFNTYQIDGLPPTPIANPGIDAIKAVAHPDSHDYLYFVAATANPSDGHIFATNYKDHRANVAKLRAIEREAAKNAEADVEAAKDAIEADQAGEAAPQ